MTTKITSVGDVNVHSPLRQLFKQVPKTDLHVHIGGSARKVDIEGHREALEYIRDNGPASGISLTIHAGETKSSENISGVESIRKAIEYGAERIAHALRLQDDKELKNYVIEHNIPIEMAPWSHVQINAVDSYPEHPIKEFLEEGMNINLVTDNRLMSQITLTKQLEQLWFYNLITKWDQIKQTTINGIMAAFISEIEKQKLLKEVQEEFKDLEQRFARTIERYLSEDKTRKAA